MFELLSCNCSCCCTYIPVTVRGIHYFQISEYWHNPNNIHLHMQQTQANNTTGNRAAQPSQVPPLDPLVCLSSNLLVVLCEHLAVNYLQVHPRYIGHYFYSVINAANSI